MVMKKYILINIGCHECGVGHEVVGVYRTEEEAEKVASKQKEWRDGGQSVPEVFEVEI